MDGQRHVQACAFLISRSKRAQQMALSDLVIEGTHLPGVSVIIGNYNQAGFVADAIASVARQSYRNFECVIVDDRSADDSAARITQSLAEMHDERFRFIPRTDNGGQMAAMMTGLDATTAPFLAFVDADDIWHPEFLEAHIAAHLSRAGAAGVSTSDMALIEEDGTMISGGSPGFRAWNPSSPDVADYVSNELGEGGTGYIFVERFIAHRWLWSSTSGMMFRRSALQLLRPGTPERIKICADNYLAVAAHMLGGTVRIERTLGHYRLHGANSWAKHAFVGRGTTLGAARPDVERAVRSALIERFCAAADDLMRIMSRSDLARILVSYLGWGAAIALHDSNAAARKMLGGWLTPQRRLTWFVMRKIPLSWRPREFRPPPE